MKRRERVIPFTTPEEKSSKPSKGKKLWALPTFLIRKSAEWSRYGKHSYEKMSGIKTRRNQYQSGARPMPDQCPTDARPMPDRCQADARLAQDNANVSAIRHELPLQRPVVSFKSTFNNMALREADTLPQRYGSKSNYYSPPISPLPLPKTHTNVPLPANLTLRHRF